MRSEISVPYQQITGNHVSGQRMEQGDCEFRGRYGKQTSCHGEPYPVIGARLNIHVVVPFECPCDNPKVRTLVKK